MNVMPNISCIHDKDCYQSIVANYLNSNEDIDIFLYIFKNISIYMVYKDYLIKPAPSNIQIGCYLASTRYFVGICI